MCDAFWGRGEDAGEDSRLLAEVKLSARQAYTGASVPLDVPLRATCALCGGRGETWTEACRACDGSGESLVRHQVTLSVPARVPDGSCFRFSITAPQALPTHIEIRVAIR
jgi:DnaJ-class molecular chaperone